jgi:hypothetical protein
MDAWPKVVEGAVVAGATGAILSWVLRSRKAAAERGTGATVMRYPRAMHVVAWVLLAVPLVGLAVLGVLSPPKADDVVYFVGLVAGFGVLGGWLVIEVTGVAHALRADGLERVTPWRGRRLLPWSRVTVLRYSDSLQSFRIATSGGDATWLSQYLSGLGSFARAALEHVRPEVIDREPRTRSMLVRLAASLEGSPATGAGRRA